MRRCIALIVTTAALAFVPGIANAAPVPTSTTTTAAAPTQTTPKVANAWLCDWFPSACWHY